MRSQLKYACVVWDPDQIKHISNLKKEQMKAAPFVKQDYSKFNSVTRMIYMNLAGKTYKIGIRLNMLYKVINETAKVSNKEILISADTCTRSKH